MNNDITSLFQNTIADSFSLALGDLGSAGRDVILDSLERRGIGRNDVFARFGEVVKILEKSLGPSCRFIINKTLKEFSRKRLESRLQMFGQLEALWSFF